MSAPAFTPGPWHADTSANRLDVVRAIAKQLSVDVPLVRDDRRFWVAAPFDRATGETEANIRLMAAAPDYFEAADLMIAAEQSGGDLWWKGFEMLKAAHAKAGADFPSRGESPSTHQDRT